ncbi:DUF937 domain-containing protein [Clostridia bacterium]|nr:DUF937 domain-containing protein [Clostridia bacterium]
MDLLKMIFDQVDESNALGKLGSEVGAEPSQVENLMKMGIPILMQKMGQNASTSEGRSTLERVLEQHQDDDTGDFNDFLQRVDVNEGDKILSHVFSSNNSKVSQGLAQKSGMDSGQVMGIMSRLAPFVLGMLGQQKKQNVDTGQIAGLLGNAFEQGKSDGLLDMAADFLDFDNDGSIMDDAGKLLSGFLKK